MIDLIRWFKATNAQQREKVREIVEIQTFWECNGWQLKRSEEV